MIYGPTLNTHLPVLADISPETRYCRFGPSDWADENPELCRLFRLHHQLADAIDAMVMDPDLPPADILIVGDHMPPSLTGEAACDSAAIGCPGCCSARARRRRRIAAW